MAAKSKSHANRGMQLERKIDRSNKKYLTGAGIARTYVGSVHKVPTGNKALRNSKKELFIVHQKAKMTDYVGVILGGHAIAFDAKETKGKSLPLKNIHDEQYKFLETWHNYGATTFLVVHFKDLDMYYRVSFKKLHECFKRSREGGRKSISYEELDTPLIYQDGMIYYLEGL